jgi:uncharacterized repeat protein (TIGR03803 family)
VNDRDGADITRTATVGVNRTEEDWTMTHFRRATTLLMLIAGWLATTRPLPAQASFTLLHSFWRPPYPLSALIQAADGNLYGTGGGGTYGAGVIFEVDASGKMAILHSFNGAIEGTSPSGPLSQATDGYFYGTTSYGGANGKGTVFRADASGHLTTLHSFNVADGILPSSGVIQGADGDFYGTTYGGGTGTCMYGPCGTVFKIDAVGNLTTLHSFNGDDGDTPNAALIQANDGFFYGTTAFGGTAGTACCGTVFKIDGAGNFTKLHSFTGPDGGEPVARLLQAADGLFYGTTDIFGGGSGTVFKMDASGAMTTLHVFTGGTDGSYPQSGLIEASDGYLYGTTSNAGTFAKIYRIDHAGQFTPLHSFEDPNYATGNLSELVQAADGFLYGTLGGDGSLFKMDLSGNFTTLYVYDITNGDTPSGLVQASDGSFYGTTAFGGESYGNLGTVFRMNGAGDVTTIHSFEVAGTQATLIQGDDGELYGTTAGGGDGYGTIFSVDTSGTFTNLHNLAREEGVAPEASLLQAADGNFYGTTLSGLPPSQGTIFRFESSGVFTQLHSFNGLDGATPRGPVLQGTDGNFYGTTEGGGSQGLGTLFKMDAANNLTVLYSFSGPDGERPSAGLIAGSDGSLYGTTPSGGATARGTIFKVDASGNFTTLLSFTGPDGEAPYAGLIPGSGGTLYGTTSGGGAFGFGTVFRLDAGGLQTLHSFDGQDGRGPNAALFVADDGLLYGTTPAGGKDDVGAVFRIDTSLLVAAIAPPSGAASASPPVVIFGEGFDPGDIVTIGGLAAGNVSVVGPLEIDAVVPALSPGTLNDVVVERPASAQSALTAALPKAYFADFSDVPTEDSIHDYVEAILRAGITAGCGGGDYCRDSPVRREQMAVFLLKAEHGMTYTPPPCGTDFFDDVPCSSPYAAWIYQLWAESITAGCSDTDYCPSNPVTRAQMAAFLLKAEHGSGYAPPACMGIFEDVACPSLFAAWVEQLAAEGVTVGCSLFHHLYCPDAPTTRGQMAVYIVKTFGLASD